MFDTDIDVGPKVTYYVMGLISQCSFPLNINRNISIKMEVVYILCVCVENKQNIFGFLIL